MCDFLNELKDFVMFHYYHLNDNYETDDYLERKIKIYEHFIKKKHGKKLTHGIIEDKYIKDIFDNENIQGFFFKNKFNNKYAGFIMFTMKDSYVEINLIGTSKNKDTRSNKKIGTLMLKCLEKFASLEDYSVLKSNAVIEAIDFYIKNGWKIKKEDKVNGMYYIKKKIIQNEENLFAIEDSDNEENIEKKSNKNISYVYEESIEEKNDELVLHEIIKKNPNDIYEYDEDGDCIMIDL